MTPLNASDCSDKSTLPDGIMLPLEIRVHGRGGQGGVTCAKLIAALYARMGLAVQTFGDYGSERSGAPVQAFTRVDRHTVTNRNKVYSPGHLLVLDPGLLETPVLSGVPPGALILLNTTLSPAEFGDRFSRYRLAVVDATDIAREQGIGSSSVVIINTTILGAYARLLGLPISRLEEIFASLGLGSDLVAAEQAYERVRIQEPSATSVQAAEMSLQTPEPPPVPPITGQAIDIPVTLQTGLWSNQSPAYHQYTPPCNVACPAGNDIVGFIQALKHDGPEAAAAILLQTQALPSVCGRVCPAPCMTECNRKSFDGAVNIRSLERWIADHSRIVTPEPVISGVVRRIAVVGGGPAGLSAAYQLALRGHDVTINEGAPALGGVLLGGIPEFRLPLEVLSRDIDRILALGVRAVCGKKLDSSDLLRICGEFDAVIIATGFGIPHELGAEGERLIGVEQGLPWLARVKQSGKRISGNVVVVGGGNSAIDCARSALRCGAASVRLVYRRRREEMPAIPEEITEAEQEGIRLMTLRQPLSFIGTERVTGILLAEVEPGAPDSSGRSRPVVTERTALISCDMVLLALGQENGNELLPTGWQAVNGRALMGGKPLQVWLAGDCATGEGTVTHAIGNGRRTALAALAALDGRTVDQQEENNQIVAPAQIRFSHFEVDPPRKDRHLPLATARESFREFNLGLAGPEEAERCFSCGHCTRCDTCLIYCPDGVIYRSSDGYRVDQEKCKGCGMCVAECPRSAMEMNEKTVQGVRR